MYLLLVLFYFYFTDFSPHLVFVTHSFLCCLRICIVSVTTSIVFLFSFFFFYCASSCRFWATKQRAQHLRVAPTVRTCTSHLCGSAEPMRSSSSSGVLFPRPATSGADNAARGTSSDRLVNGKTRLNSVVAQRAPNIAAVRARSAGGPVKGAEGVFEGTPVAANRAQSLGDRRRTREGVSKAASTPCAVSSRAAKVIRFENINNARRGSKMGTNIGNTDVAATNINSNRRVETTETVTKRDDCLTLEDVEELRRRREQLRYGVDTSLARIAELRQLTQGAGFDPKNPDDEIGSTFLTDGSGMRLLLRSNIEKETCSLVSNNVETEILLRATEQECEEFRCQLTMACAALSAVPQTLWVDIRGFRQPPLAVEAVMDAVLLLLGLPQSKHMRLGFSGRKWPNFPQQLIDCDPQTARSNIMGTGGQEFRINGHSHMENLQGFLSKWTHLRVSRVHPTLGPLHRWIKAMMDVIGSLERLEALKAEPNATTIAAEADKSSLLEELKENEEYVQLAQQKIVAIDALVADVAAVGRAGHNRDGLGSGPSREGVRSPGTVDLTGVTVGVAGHRDSSPQPATTKGRETQCKEPVMISNGKKFCSFSFGHNAAADSKARTPGQAPDVIIPPLNLSNCLPSFLATDSGTLSLRERFEQLRATSVCQSPRLGQNSLLDASAIRSNFNTSVVDTANPVNNVGLMTPARMMRDREDLLMRVHQLEEQLNDICSSKTKEVEVVLLRDELAAAQEEVSKLRAERDELQQRVRRYDTYYRSSPAETCAEEFGQEAGCAWDVATATDAMTVVALEQQLRLAHARIRQLEPDSVGLVSDDGTHCTSVSGSRNESPESVNGLSSRPTTFTTTSLLRSTSNVGNAVVLQRRIEDMQKDLDERQRALNEAEERLNAEIHANKEAGERLRLLQAELHSVWQRLEKSEYQLKVVMEDSCCYYCRGTFGPVGSKQPQRDVVAGEETERLRMELLEQKRRVKEERKRRNEVKKVRAAILLRLENGLKEALREQQGESAELRLRSPQEHLA
ncbi:unnamed protein product [Trypanosoma congolense IL3000]|uniref:WGS project CAEQ00000000 data, annotated contig 1469 n=1 Tax=Trypanosoma congolense (strain IL3000) TaxID=1068625 RepID=F9W6H7_TRYCI|nr:unnamed protein product [Trypanosoma congolense IL3000]